MPTTSFILFNLSKDQSVLQAISAPEKLFENATDCNLKSLDPLNVTAKVSFVKNRKERRKDTKNKIIFVIFI